MSALEWGRPYLSIGEVLNVLKEEFPDVTVSKIRFLESEGLIHPERTPSGYRKFTSGDVERLRFILRLQRDHFLPLKVIRQRLASWEAEGPRTPEAAPQLTLAPQPEPAPAAANEEPQRRLETGVSMSAEELARAAGLSPAEVEDLRSYGLLRPTSLGDGQLVFSEADLEVARLSRDLLRLGVEARHLRILSSTADRWAALASQMVAPLTRQRNPEARRQASETVREMARVSSKLVQTLLREAFAPIA